MYVILQWNCQGYRAKYEDIRRILSVEHPAVALLQETMLNDYTPRPPAGYTIYSTFNRPAPGNGLVTLIRNDVPHREIDIQTNLQATAFRIMLSRQYTICNIYLSPSIPINLNEITNLISQLTPPVIICGDFNSRHQIWDSACTQHNARSQAIESLLLSTSLTVLNNGNATHFHMQTGSTSAIDLSLCSAGSVSNFSWHPMDDLYGSDHYPLLISELERNAHEPQERYLEDKADWTSFYEDTRIDNYNTTTNTTTELIDFYNNHIITAADKAIPKSNGYLRPRKVPWWTPECTETNRKRKEALRRYQRSLLIADRIAYCRARAVAKTTEQFMKNN